jgi:hypothetical protein
MNTHENDKLEHQEIKGAQLGLVNTASELEGLQIGGD